MKKILFLVSTLVMMMTSCETKDKEKNPFLSEFDTPYQTPPFDKIKESDFIPAFEAGMKQQAEQVDAIVNNADEATFENTIVALDQSGEILSRVSGVFGLLKGANTNATLDSIDKVLSPLLSEHSDNINLNANLFKRVEHVKANDYANRSTEDQLLIDEYYKVFVRSGINLSEDKQKRVREINKELSDLTRTFGNNVLQETSNFELVIDNEEDLKGLPSGLIAAAADQAKKTGKDGKWVFTLSSTSWEPFVTYSPNRALREKVFTAMNNRGNNNNEFDNKEIIQRIVTLRLEKANLLGFDSHSSYVLDVNMAKNPQNVNELLSNIWKYAVPKAKEESKDLAEMAKKSGDKIDKIQPWDWWYYAEKVRKDKYDLDEEEVKAYFKAENVRKGVFATANKLYGINFEKIDVPVYQEDVEAFKVTDADNEIVGIIYFDSYARPGAKRPGAWMGSIRKQAKKDGKRVFPIIYNVGNYNPPADGKPALLSLDQVNTMFHEFGHGLHGLLSDINYRSLSGTAVPRDFVELPSQIMEHWAFEPEVLKMYAKHYDTGEVIPDELIEKIQATSTFNQGFRTTELVAAAKLDMSYHTLTSNPDLADVKDGKKSFDVEAFEKKAMKDAGLIDEIIPRYRSTYFQHIFSGGYSSGYYSYLWSEVLDADAFNAFEEKGIFDAETAKSFKDNVLTKGGSDDPMKMYEAFRGAKPNEVHMLKNRGLIK